MPVITKSGDLFESTTEVIGHGVNVQGVMGAGIAVLFKERYPKNYRLYQEACQDHLLESGGCLMVEEDGRIVANIASQTLPGADATVNFFERGLRNVLKIMNDLSLKSIAIPRIGTGIGGLSLEEFETVVEKVSEEFPEITIEVWSLLGPK